MFITEMAAVAKINKNSATTIGESVKFWCRILLATCWCLSLFISSLAAAPLLRPLTPDQGLSQGSIRDLLIDNDGFLWLATDGGVNRYDSNQVVQITAAGYELKDLVFTKIVQDANGRIWAAAATAGIYLYNADIGQFDLFMPIPKSQEQQRPNSIISLLPLDDTHLLFLMNDAVYRLSLDTAQPELLFSLSDNGIENGWLRTAILQDEHLFIGAFNGLVHLDLLSGKFKYIPYLTEQTLSKQESSVTDQRHVKYLQIHKQRLWIGTVEGLYSISYPDLLQFISTDKPYQPQQHVEKFNIWQLHWQDDLAMLGTEQGLYEFNSITNQLKIKVRFTDSDMELYDNNILDIAADNYGGYWLGSRNDGAFYWHPRAGAFTNIARQKDVQHSLSSEKVYAVVNGVDNTLWVGTGNGVNQINLQTSIITQYLKNNDTKAVWHSGTILNIFPETASTLWLYTGEGLRHFNTETNELTPPAALTDNDQRLMASQLGYIYRYNDNFYFTYDGHYYRYTIATKQVVMLPEIENAIPTMSFGGFLGPVNNQNQLLLAAADQLWLYDIDKKQLRLVYQHSDFKPELSRWADAMVQDKNGVLWVGFPGIGLLGFDSNSLTLLHTLNENNKLLSNIAYAPQRDDTGNIWFSSHQGISRLNPITLQVENFSKADGLISHEYNGAAGTKLADGTLVFGSMRGITMLTPEFLITEDKQPSAIITGLSTQTGSLLALSGNLNNRHVELTYQDLGIQLNFSSMNFRDAHKMRYRFWLAGDKQLAYPLQSNSQVMFPQLSQGNYVFNVVAISPTNGLESLPARLYLHVKPAPWFSNWAMLFYVLLLLLIINKIIRIRRKQQRLIQQAHIKVLQSEQRLKQALASVNSGAWEWLAETEKLYASRVYKMLGYAESMNPLTLPQHEALIHPDDKANFSSKWQRFMEFPENAFDCTYRMQHSAGNWLWFRDMGKATELDDDGKVIRVLGTFSNITETRANSEKARLFGEAFQQTRDWVVIMDNQQRLIAANQSFALAFGNMEQYLDRPRIHHLGISLVRRRFYTKLLQKLKPGEHWQGEELVITPDGRERPTLINISAVGEQQQMAFFVLVFTDITEQKLAEDELRYLANYDALTGLPNRALLMDRIYHGIDQAKRDKKSLALCFIDLDKFKQINDSLGHDVGDLLLKEVARRLTLTLRESDTVARLGGDEFVVLLEGYKAEDNISHVARKMLTIVGEPMQLGSHTVGVSPSIGIAVYPQDAMTAAELLKHADVAMYHAKAAGRNNFQFFTAEMNEKAHMQLARETRFRKALQQNEFINYYQPIINSQTNQVVGAEVLLRWQSSDGMVSPAEFIPLAEELRLIINMTQQLLERALADLQYWHKQGFPLYLSVNLSTQHLEQPALAEHTRFLLEKYQLPASCLRYEVTESALMRDHQSAIETMLALNELGIQLALDDFGTGYSSLKYLKELPIDGIKIDRSFVKDIGIDSNDETIIDAMLSMASSLGMYCVAEGVETEQQLAFFSRRQCYLIQGFLFAKPMPSDALLTYLQNESPL